MATKLIDQYAFLLFLGWYILKIDLFKFQQINKQLNTMHSRTKFNKQPFLQFPKQSYSFINQFPQDNQYGCKIYLKTAKGTISLFQNIHNHKGTSLITQAKFWFALSHGSSIFGRIRGDHLKVQYDNGYSIHFDKKINFYGSLHYKRPFNNLSCRLGAYYKNDGYKIDNRLKIQSKSADKSKYNLFWHSKALKVINNWRFGSVMSVDLIQRFITKNNIFVGYLPSEQLSIFLRGQNEQYRIDPIKFQQWTRYFDNVYLDLIYRLDNKTKLGFETLFQLKKNPIKEVSLVMQRKIDEKLTGKIKINNRLDFNLLIKGQIFNNPNYRIQIGISGTKMGSAERQLKNGIQFDLNI